MATDFDNIGLQVKSGEEFGRLLRDNSSRWPRVQTPIGGAYIRAGGPDGGELWIQLSPTGELMGAHPHFSGTSRFKASASRAMDGGSRGGTPLDGALLCALVDDQSGVPFVVDVPDYRLHAAWLSPNTSIVLQLSAFPRGIQLFANETGHSKSPLGKLAPDGALIPSGLFKPGGEAIVPPKNDVVLAGRVEMVRSLTSSLGDRPFYSLSVRTLGGVIDVPLAPGVAAIAPAPGAIIAGSFALSARLIDPLPTAPAEIIARAQRQVEAVQASDPRAGVASKPSLLRRLFGG